MHPRRSTSKTPRPVPPAQTDEPELGAGRVGSDPLGVESLTARQRRIVEVIQACVSSRGYPPSVREIGEAVGLTSPSSVSHQLVVLQRKGFLRRDPNRPRAIEVVLPHSGQASAGSLGDSSSQSLTDEGVDGPSQNRTDNVHMLHSNRPGSARAGRKRAAHPAQQGLSADLEQASQPRYVPMVGRIAAGVPITAEQSVEEMMPLPAQLVGEGTLFMLEVQGESMIEAAICSGDWVVVRQQPNAEQGEIVAAMIDGEATVKTLRYRDGAAWLYPANAAYEPFPAGNATILGIVKAVMRKL